jgi:hypothetical protein
VVAVQQEVLLLKFLLLYRQLLIHIQLVLRVLLALLVEAQGVLEETPLLL